MSLGLVVMRNIDKNMTELRQNSLLGLCFWSVRLLVNDDRTVKGGGGSVLGLWFWPVNLLAYHDQTAEGGGGSVFCVFRVVGVLDKERCFLVHSYHGCCCIQSHRQFNSIEKRRDSTRRGMEAQFLFSLNDDDW